MKEKSEKNFGARFKEGLRKKLVWLKRNPQIFALIVALIALIISTFTLNVYSPLLTGIYNDDFAETSGIEVSAWIRNPALYIFIQVLFSFLLLLTSLSTYKRGKRSYFMLSLSIIMIIALVACDVLFLMSINFFTSDEYGVPLDELLVSTAKSRTVAHLVFSVLAGALSLLTPVIKMLLGKINTSVEDDYDERMDQKSEEELMIEMEDEA